MNTAVVPLRPNAGLPSDDVLLRTFNNECRVKGLRPSTVRAYNAQLRGWRAYAEEIGKAIPELTRTDINNYIAEQIEAERAPKTINHKIISLRQLYESVAAYCEDEDIPWKNPARRILPMKADETARQALTTAQVGRVMAYLDKRLNYDEGRRRDSKWGSQHFGRIRDRVIVLLLLDTMIRVGELARIELEHVDFDRRRILLPTTKGRRPRIVPFSEALAAELQEYLRFRMVRVKRSNFVFCTNRGNPIREYNTRELFNRLSKALGFRIHAHLFRRTGATWYIENGGNVMVLQKVLGHKQLTTTQIYVSLGDEQAGVDHEHYGPIQRLSLNTRESEQCHQPKA